MLMPSYLRPLTLGLILALAVMAVGVSHAQNAAPTPKAPIVAETSNELDRIRATLLPIEAGLSRENLSDDELMEIRNRVEPLRVQLENAVNVLQPKLDIITRRLAELGDPPKEGMPPEGEDVVRERETQKASFQGIDDVMRRARALLVQATQVADTAAERRRAQFAEELFQSQPSLLNPDLWVATAAGFPKDISSLSTILKDAAERLGNRLTTTNITILAVALLLAVVLWGPGRVWANRLGQRFAVQQVPPHRLRRSGHALWVLVVTAIAPTLAALVLLHGLRLSGMLTPRLEPLAVTIVFAVAFIAFMDGLAKGILSPDKASWRLPDMPDELAHGIRVQAGVVSTVYALGLIVSSLNLVVVTRAEATLVTGGLFALANALTFAIALKVLRIAQSAEGDDAAPDINPVLGLFRLFVWIAIAAIIISVTVGYITFAKFLAHQVIWISIVGALLYLFAALIDDLFTIGFTGDGPASRWLRYVVGLRRSSVEQIGILLSGFFRIVLYGMAALALLAPWGIGSYDAFGWLRALAFGFSIGGFRVSISAILLAVAILAIGILITRSVQKWLATQFLPKTRIEPGLQNSIGTGIGYLGVILAAIFALGTVGLNLQNVAIVAGALSVGIGFGLQSIVNNFVSGLILLAERPVKVGDWVAIGTTEGNIRKISVRATEIELFDRSTLIVPNSELISQKVINKTHASPLGRIKIVLKVAADADLDRVRGVMLDAAAVHAEVLKEPAPSVVLGEIGSVTVELTFYAYVATPRRVSAVKSDLHFAITKVFRAEGIVIPVAAPDAQAESIKDVAKAIDGLAERLASLLPATQGTSPSRKES